MLDMPQLRHPDELCERVERDCQVYRLPDFRLVYDPAINWRLYQSVYEQEAIQAAKLRRVRLEAFAISMFSAIAAGAFVIFIFFPL